ncbi:MAG: DNA-binding protein [bacterium]|nr:DNA-binding protein [bacterium]
MKATQDNRRHIIVLERGENVLAMLAQYCAEKNITAGVFQAIGAVERVQIGYYDMAKREYHFREEAGVFEVASMNGNVALVDEKPFVHAHAVLSRCDKSLECIGAHIKEAYVAVTLEVFLIALDMSLGRIYEEDIGLKLLTV